MNDEQSLLSIYYKMISSDKIEKNKSQEKLVSDLEALKKKLENSLELKQTKTRKMFSKFFSKKKSSEEKLGVYIYGGVGIGKSMLMDLFFNLLDIKGKKRIHFHEFMKQLHQLVKIARENNIRDPIKSVASEYIKDIQVLCLDEMQITDVADAMIVGRVFEEFLGKKLNIVTTSNRHPNDLYKDGLNRKLFLPFIDIIVSLSLIHI